MKDGGYGVLRKPQSSAVPDGGERWEPIVAHSTTASAWVTVLSWRQVVLRRLFSTPRQYIIIIISVFVHLCLCRRVLCPRVSEVLQTHKLTNTSRCSNNRICSTSGRSHLNKPRTVPTSFPSGVWVGTHTLGMLLPRRSSHLWKYAKWKEELSLRSRKSWTWYWISWSLAVSSSRPKF